MKSESPALAESLEYFRQKLQEGGSIAPAYEELQSIIVELGNEVGRLAHILQLVLAYNRIRVIGGYRPLERCKACDVPHVASRQCPCPHHKALALLTRLGVQIE